MTDPARERHRPSRTFWLCALLAGPATWLLHELAHYLAGRALGYEMWMTLNKAGTVDGAYDSLGHSMGVAMAGPALTIAQGGLAFVLAGRGRAAAYPFLFLACFMRAVAFGVGFSHPNDEARTSLDLGLPVWVLPSLVVGLLLFWTVRASRGLTVGWRTNAALYALASLAALGALFGEPALGRLLGPPGP